MNQNLIKPIMLIRKNVKQFSEDTSSIDNSLSTITTRDEVEDLAMAIGKMEKTIVEYIEDIKNGIEPIKDENKDEIIMGFKVYRG